MAKKSLLWAISKLFHCAFNWISKTWWENFCHGQIFGHFHTSKHLPIIYQIKYWIEIRKNISNHIPNQNYKEKIFRGPSIVFLYLQLKCQNITFIKFSNLILNFFDFLFFLLNQFGLEQELLGHQQDRMYYVANIWTYWIFPIVLMLLLALEQP